MQRYEVIAEEFLRLNGRLAEPRLQALIDELRALVDREKLREAREGRQKI